MTGAVGNTISESSFASSPFLTIFFISLSKGDLPKRT